ncbi:LemA family protein [candidate division KSB3 bacterium]|uniref:LemA family protein n=1 Tax=candidate division KSB3 bacterium TaxID=2044937 RepID=A0A9D5JV43_9BACT|nr:LemA family protein [candidate division KSB3 bacterium]MBD3324819.1 LemA family protein [candidate division KSB3 bacterium]
MIQKQASQKKIILGVAIAIAVIVLIAAFALMSQYNTMIEREEQVMTAWGQVENVYQRRYDLVPNLVETVKAYAEHEQELFQMITAARANAGGVLQISDDALRDPATLQKFQEAQAQLSSVLQRMMVVVEQNPNIKADQNFLALQAQLEGTENRIAVERKRFNEAVQAYNSYIKRFPQVLVASLFGFETKVYFSADEGAENAPAVNFN